MIFNKHGRNPFLEPPTFPYLSLFGVPTGVGKKDPQILSFSNMGNKGYISL